MAKGRKTSLAVRALALLFALGLAALAARLWLGNAPRAAREPSGTSGPDAPELPLAEDYETAPPLHDPIRDEDRERLRELLREQQEAGTR